MPIRDVHSDGEAQVLWVAHEGGLSQYDIVTGEWTVPVDGVTAARRLEAAEEGLYVEQTDGQLLFVRLEDLSIVRLLADLRSWAVDGSGVAVAVRRGPHDGPVRGERDELPDRGESRARARCPIVGDRDRGGTSGPRGRPHPHGSGGGLVHRDPDSLRRSEGPLARAESDLLLLDGSGQIFRIAIDSLGRDAPGWESTWNSEARDLLQLDGAVLAIGVDASAWRYDERLHRFRAILNGPRKGPRRPPRERWGGGRARRGTLAPVGGRGHTLGARWRGRQRHHRLGDPEGDRWARPPLGSGWREAAHQHLGRSF